MENSIKERARDYAPDPVDPDCIPPAREGHIVNQQRIAYIAGATEQKIIDNDKAKDAFNKACGWLSTYTWYNEVFDEFIKVLEE